MAQANIKRGREIAQDIRSWIDERNTAGDIDNWIQTTGPKAFKGIKRKELAKLLGISTSTLNVNEAAAELRNAEYLWSMAYLQKDVDSKSATAEKHREKKLEKRSNSKAKKLEAENIVLKAENRLLRARLIKYEAIDDLLKRTARVPRSRYEEF